MESKNNMDEILDAVTAKAAALAAEELGNSIPMPDEQPKFSLRHRRRIKKLLNGGNGNRRLLKAAAIIAGVFLLGSAGGAYAVRSGLINFFYDKSAPNTSYNFGADKGVYFDLNYIPSGFSESEHFSGSSGETISFSDGNDLWFDFSADSIGSNFNVDTENASVENILVNGDNAVYVAKDDVNMVVWSSDDFGMSVIGNIPKEEILKIAENAREK